MDTAIVNFVQMIIPGISSGLAMTISYVLTFLIGIAVAIPTVLLWVRKHFPVIIAFFMYVYKQTEKAEDIREGGRELPGVEKKEIVMNSLAEAMLDPENKLVTPKNLSLFKKITGIAGKLGNVIEFVLPITKLILKKKKP